jgi:hypothetical protein
MDIAESRTHPRDEYYKFHLHFIHNKKRLPPPHHLCSLRFNFKPPITLRGNTGETGGMEVLVTKISFKEYRVSQKKEEKTEQNGET